MLRLYPQLAVGRRSLTRDYTPTTCSLRHKFWNAASSMNNLDIKSFDPSDFLSSRGDSMNSTNYDDIIALNKTPTPNPSFNRQRARFECTYCESHIGRSSSSAERRVSARKIEARRGWPLGSLRSFEAGEHSLHQRTCFKVSGNHVGGYTPWRGQDRSLRTERHIEFNHEVRNDGAGAIPQDRIFGRCVQPVMGCNSAEDGADEWRVLYPCCDIE